MKFIHRYRRNRAVKKYVLKLAPLLVKRYGTSDQYTVGQIERTIREFKFSMPFAAYAVALFRYEESFNTIKRYQLNQHALNQVRCELMLLLGLARQTTPPKI